MNLRVLALVASLVLACDDDRGTTIDASATDGRSQPDGFNCSVVFCPASFAVVGVDVGCVAANVTDASLSGPCAPTDGGDPFACAEPTGLPNEVPFKTCKRVVFRTPNAGACGVALRFDDGFDYSGQVDITRAPPDLCCQGMFSASPSTLVVTEPDASCADAGDAGDAD